MGYEDPHVVEGQLEGDAKEVSYGKRRLGARPQGDHILGAPLADCHVGFHRDVLYRRIGIFALDYPLRFGKALVDVAFVQLALVGYVGSRLRGEGRLEIGIVSEVRMDQGGIRLHGVHMVEDRVADFVFDLDEVDRPFRDFERIGGDRGNRFAVIADFFFGENVLVDDVEPELVVEFLAEKDRADSAQGFGFRNVYPLDHSPRMGAFLDLCMQHARERHVADIGCASVDFFRGFRARRVLSYMDKRPFISVFLHISSPP